MIEQIHHFRLEKPIRVMAKLEEGDVMSDGLHRGEWLILLPLGSKAAIGLSGV